ncbi:hypothetical protein CVIRNUC_002998 [Coccomyxa viridis]|uniref:Transmembrane protein 65 n=1 Tax=Coccomyxa viridis TaxID=1274662 RepID=A0AAV1HXT3_9CHLO|nr:hypothetical protein CVIRNUC_002998 [Coccomyxa viridis]
MFGARFGLSTLAAAGFGNLISDVVGLGTAEPVQAKFNKWFPMKSLTGQQQLLWQTRAAKFGGCTLGVSVGCLLGMAPLFFIDGHKGKDGQPSLSAH